ncbi:MAG: LysR family transcriptional regulator [Akkermansiaceae bacterium]|nr:LysR family transcriptional regulator [Akkermansiaceae bacterium]
MLSEIQDGVPLSRCAVGIDPGIVDSKRLQMFYVAAKEGGFGTAASLLGVSPSAVSHAIKALEEDLGCALFKRNGPQVSPTGAGVRLLPMVEELLQRMSLLKSELAAIDGRIERLTFTIPAELQGLLRSGTLSMFNECFPLVLLEISVGLDPDRVEAGCDFGIRYGTGGETFPGQIRRDLFEEELVWCAAPFHELGQRGKITPGELRQSLLIYPDRGAHELAVRHLGRAPNADPRKWILPNPECARDLTRQGQGIALLPWWSVRDAIDDGSLVALRVQGVEFKRVCCAVWLPGCPLTWVADVFLNLVAAEFSKENAEPV